MDRALSIVFVLLLLSSCSRRVESPIVVETDGPFVLLSNGLVIDEDRSIMWRAADNRSDVDFEEAQEYLSEVRAGGYRDWRLPTIQELESLMVPGAGNETPPGPGCYGSYDIHRFFELTCCCPWALEDEGTRPASFPFLAGMGTMWHHNSGRSGNRVLPVRDLEDD